MRPHWWTDDDELVAELGRALDAPAPGLQAIIDAGVAAYAWRTVDADLAALSYDSACNDTLLATTRSVTESRLLTFQAGDIGVEIELGDGVLRGQLLPPRPGHVLVRTADGEECSATADEVGFFVVSITPHSPFRLRCTTATGARVVTDWTRW